MTFSHLGHDNKVMNSGASSQQVQPVRGPVLHMRDLQPPNRHFTNPRHQQVPQLPVPQLRI